MALSRLWYTRGNVPLSDFTTAQRVAQSVLWAFKEALLGTLAGGTNGINGAQPVSANWNCAGSSDSVAAGMDAVDRWGSPFDASKIVRSAGPHSWIVLQGPTMATGPYYICIDYNTGADAQINVFASKNPFTGGSITARPTAVAEWTVINASQFVESVATDHRVHYTVDGSGNFYFQLSKLTAGIFCTLIMGLELANARIGDLHQFFTTFHFLNTGRGAPSATVLSSNLAGRTYNNGAAHVGGAIDYSGVLDGTMAANQADGKFDTLSVYVYSTVGGASGIRGQIPDLAGIGAATVGGSEPITITQERVVAGSFLIPNGVVPVL